MGIGDPDTDAVAAQVDIGSCANLCTPTPVVVLLPSDAYLIPPNFHTVYVVTCNFGGNVNVPLVNPIADACPTLSTKNCAAGPCSAIGIPPEGVNDVEPTLLMEIPPSVQGICHGVVNVWVLTVNVVQDLNVLAPCAVD